MTVLCSTTLTLLGSTLTASLILCTAAWPDTEPPESFAVHGQFTYVEQETSGFTAPYRGANSLSPEAGAETTDATLYLGARAWEGAEIWVNGELDQGRGLNDTLGAAGFPSGEAYKVGKNQPYLRLTRLFIRQTLEQEGGTQSIDSAANQLGGSQSENRVVVQLGKFSVGDVFDASKYAHDPRMDFLNWSALDAGSFDYAADAWGYTVGAALQWFHGAWIVRGGLFDLSNIPNSAHLEPGFHEFQYDVEVERGYSVGAHPGSALVTLFDSRARMGLLDDAVAQASVTGGPVDISSVRRYRSRLGASVRVDQEIAGELGGFVRLGKSAGNVEAYEFTDIDRTVAAGLSLQGGRWRRTDDTLGVIGIVNGISAERERYLNAGGLGILVGDGRLPHPRSERIIETYYSVSALRYAHLTFDYQWIDNPAYNSDRGPVSVFAVRLHAQF